MVFGGFGGARGGLYKMNLKTIVDISTMQIAMHRFQIMTTVDFYDLVKRFFH